MNRIVARQRNSKPNRSWTSCRSGVPKRTASLAIFALASVLAVTAGAKNLKWTAASNTNWDFTTKNWVDTDTGVAAVFANGDSVTFDDTAETAQCKVAANVTPGAIVFDLAADFTLLEGGGLIQAKSGRTDKYGVGTLLISGNVSVSTGDAHIWKGAVKNILANKSNSFGGIRNIFVHDGGKLWHYERNGNDGVTGGRMNLTVYTNGVFDVSKGANGVAPLRTLTLDGGELKFGETGMDANYGALKIERGLTVRGTSPYVITNDLNASTYITIGYDNDTVFDVADITGDRRTDLTFNVPLIKVAEKINATTTGWLAPHGWHDIVKTGPGTMAINKPFVGSKSPKGTWRVNEGELAFTSIASLDWSNTNKLVASTNATLRFALRNVMTGNLDTRPLPEIVVDHGTFAMGSSDASVQEQGHNPLGPLTIDSGVFAYTNFCGFTKGSLGIFTLSGKVTIRGDKPVQFTTNGMYSTARAYIHLWDDPQEICVAKTKGGARYDLFIDHVLRDRALALNSSTLAVTNSAPSGFIKTGDGVLQLANRGSAFTGYTEIREGTVLLDKDNFGGTDGGGRTISFLGNMATEGRKIVVSTNGTLHIAQRNIFSGMSATGYPNELKAELIVRGGTLLCSNATANVGSGIGYLTLDDGDFRYYKGNDVFGLWQINHRLRLTGTRPYEFLVDHKDANIYNTQNICLIPGMATTIDVDDITGDDLPDATSELGLVQPNVTDRTKYTYGFTKTGLGTLRLTQPFDSNASLRANGDVAVAEGTLLVDTLYALKSALRIAVAEGACLGGTGKVTNVEIAAGGGLAGRSGQCAPLLIDGDLTLPENGVLRLRSDVGIDPVDVEADVAQVTGRITAPANFSGWTILLNGNPVANAGRLKLVGKRLRYSSGRGFMLLLK